MTQTRSKKTLYDAYRFPGFTPVGELKGVFGDRYARVIRLNRRSKKRCAAHVGLNIEGGMTGERARFAISLQAITGFISKWISVGSIAGLAAK